MLCALFFLLPSPRSLFIQPHTLSQQQLISCTWQRPGFNLLLCTCPPSLLKKTALMKCQTGTVSQLGERLALLPSTPSSQTRLETLPHFNIKNDCHMLPSLLKPQLRCSALQSPVAGSSPGSCRPCLLASFGSFVTDQSPPPP